MPTGFPLGSVPFPSQSPVAIAVFPNTATFTWLIWFVCHFAALMAASVSLLPLTFPSESVLMNFSAKRGESILGSLALAASIHFCSRPATACSVPPPILSCACAATISDNDATTHHSRVLFTIHLAPFCFQICQRAESYATSGGLSITGLDLL